MSSNGQVAIVTGGGSGIGKHSALALLRDGYSVAIAGRRPEPLQETVREAGTDGRMLAVQTDVGDPESVKSLFGRTMEAFGRLDVLFNNAGGGAPPVLFEDLTYEQWQGVVDSNLTGTFLCTQEAIMIMKDQTPMGGRIINNGSISAQTPRVNSAPYTATKHAITGLTKSIALDGRAFDIACGQIDIGNAGTEMVTDLAKRNAAENPGVEPEPVMDVEHVAQAVLQMAGLPLESNVLSMTIMATKMKHVGRG